MAEGYTTDRVIGGTDRGIGGTRIGNLFITNTEIGMGSYGSTVFEAYYKDVIPIAVKRLVRGHLSLSHAIPHLTTKRHPNIVRYWVFEYDSDFIYLALERCTCSLLDLIQALSAGSDFSVSPDDPPSMVKHKNKLRNLRFVMQDVNLWTDGGHPSPLLVNLLREVLIGVDEMHDLEIIHANLKPQNILITGKPLVAKLSDLGIYNCPSFNNSWVKTWDLSEYPLLLRTRGSSGWRPPEMLLPGVRRGPAIDMFSFGCVLFFCVTGGKHPFGKPREHDINVENNRMDLSSVASIPEAHDLISGLLNPDPELRPTASKALHHPFFWNSEMRLSFLSDVSDRVELEDAAPNSRLLNALENTAPVVFGARWDHKIETEVMAHLRSLGTYDGRCIRDLLRAARHRFSHHMEAPKQVKEILGPIPDGWDAYFAGRFPALLMESYKVLSRLSEKEGVFRKYFPNIYKIKMF